MSAIKSAIELAMERTKDLVMDEEEKKSLALKETENKVKAVVRRYLKGIIDGNGVDGEMARIGADEGLKKSILMDRLIDEFDISSNNELLVELLKVIGEGLKEPFKHEMEMMQKTFLDETGKRETTVREKITNRLGEIGITGSGVEPNIQAWDEWNDSVEEAGKLFKDHIIEWKNRLKTANGKQ
ncbi:MAG: hypothetical protein NT178_08590 [Proteobacteria bacterium]|nr:hypothetical protein [Pseudomonadota bacterium]